MKVTATQEVSTILDTKTPDIQSSEISRNPDTKNVTVTFLPTFFFDRTKKSIVYEEKNLGPKVHIFLSPLYGVDVSGRSKKKVGRKVTATHGVSTILDTQTLLDLPESSS